MVSCPHCGSKYGGLAFGTEALELTKRKNESVALNDKAAALFNEGNIQAAFSNIEKALELNPFNEQAYSNLGYLYIKQGNYGKAIEILEHLFNFSPFKEEAKRYLKQARELL